MFVGVAVGYDVTDVVLQGLQGGQKLEQRLLVKQGGQRDVNRDGGLRVHTGHADCCFLQGERGCRGWLSVLII